MSDKIRIRKNPNGDTRTAKKDVSIEEFKDANISHIADVSGVMDDLSDILRSRGYNHDFTKLVLEESFYNDFKSTIEHGTDFVSGEWYQKHVNTERHHLFSRCPEDVNLIDVLEMIVDCVCAGKARSGEIRDLELNDEILKRAISNTVKLINDMTEVIDE